MSSINAHYTFHYSQPEEYRFSHDSVFLSRRVFELVESRLSANMKLLDLCSGCGIVGLDFLFHCRQAQKPWPSVCDFVEVQREYESHFVANVRSLNLSAADLRFLPVNYTTCRGPEYRGKYDLLLCNPPYFRPDQGKLSPSTFKNRCRFFVDSDFSTLLSAIENCLAPGGSAFVLMRDLSDHGQSPVDEAKALCGESCVVEKVDDIRGTPLIELRKRV